MKVVLVGKGEMLCALIEGCLACGGVEIVGVFRYENLTKPFWRLILEDYFWQSIEKNLINRFKLRDLHFSSVNSQKFKQFLLKNEVDVMFVGTWCEKIKKEIFQIPKLASINVHPSLLPKFRGPNPYLQTIKQREKVSGFTFHLLDENFDTGAILYQKEIEILPYYTSKELKAKTVFEVKNILPEFLVKLDNGEIIPKEQGEGSYFPNIKTDEIMLDFELETAEQICAKIKAFYPWLPCYVTLGNEFYIPNPYKLEIVDKQTPKLIFNKSEKTITAPCKGGKTLIMRDVRKYVKHFLGF